ncbi:glycosyltransferase family protein [Ideonella paludis]|uniref:hypothetical protein n=1 Tax=Ideonella paludis TaxID=1233411 RepID=UPI00363C8D61
MKRISELLGKKAVHSGPPVITYKITVEQVLATSVIGWAASSELAPAEAFHLLVDDVVQEVTATHIHRLDVCRAIGASDQLSFGFRIALPLSLWDDSGELQAREVMLCAGNERKHLELAHTLSDWPSELEANSSHTEFSNISLALLNQLAAKDRQSQLKEEDLSYFKLLARKLGWRDWPKLQQPAPEGLLEQSGSLVWTGWIADDSNLAQAFQLFVNGHEVQIEPIRVNRSDVAEAKSLNRTDLGFEISIPASIWGHASEKSSVSLELWAGSCRLTQENIVWDLSKLTSILKDCYLKSGGTQFPREVLTLSGEGQYYFLLCLEHFLACRQEVKLERSVRSWFRHHAEIYGVKVEEELKDEAPLLNPPRHAISTIELWRLLRAFNAAVQEDGSNAKEAFQEIWQRSDIDAEVRHQLTCALIPYFCGIDRYFEIRPFLDISRLKVMAADTNAWSLSLQIPEATWTADYALATQLTSKIAYEAKGWINTECIATACRRLLHAWPSTPQHQYEAETTASAILNVLEAQSFDYWRRSHDKHLVDAATSLIMLSRRITSSFAYKALTTIILHYEFNPHFWKTLAERWDGFSFWPAELKIAHRNFIRFRYALTESTPQLSTVIEAVLPAALKGSLDASIALRDAALCAALNTKPNSETELQKGVSAACTTSPNEIIRFLSHFHASSVDNIETAAATEIVERCSGVPRTYFTSRKNSLIEGLWKQSPIQANITPKELPLLCGIEAHGIGVLIAALFAERQHRFNETNSDQVTLAEVSRHWLKLFHDTANQSVPPSALLQACQLLIDWQANPNAPKDVARIAFEFRRLLCERYGDDISEVCSGPTKLAHPTVRSRDPVKSTLVAIYTCNKYLSSRIAAIQNTWAKKLDELEIPWIIVVGNGDDSFDGRVLSLNVLDNYESLPQKSIALIKWVYNNTNFSHLFKIDDDCHVAVERLFHQSPQWGHHYLGRKLTRGLGTTDRSWHRARSESTLAKNSLDKSPEPSVYADGGSGYFLSRFAMFSVLQALSSTEGARLTRSAYMEDKLIGDLLSLKGINLSEEGYDTLVRRRFGDDPVRVCAFSNSFYPHRCLPQWSAISMMQRRYLRFPIFSQAQS